MSFFRFPTLWSAALLLLSSLAQAAPPRFCDLVLEQGLELEDAIQTVPVGRTYRYSAFTDAHELLEDVRLEIDSSVPLSDVARALSMDEEGARVAQEILESRLSRRRPAPIRLADFLPGLAADLRNERPASFYEEANCWNATICFHNEDFGIRYTGPWVMTAYMMAAYRELPRGTRLRLGDVVAFYENGALEHTAVYLADDVFFHKASMLNDSPYVFERWKGVSTSIFSRAKKVDVRFFRNKAESDIGWVGSAVKVVLTRARLSRANPRMQPIVIRNRK